MTPLGVASLDLMGLIGRIYVGDHETLLHTKYISCGPHGFRGEDFQSFFHYKLNKYVSCGPHGFREKDFISFSHYKSNGANVPRGVASLDPRGLFGRIYIGDH